MAHAPAGFADSGERAIPFRRRVELLLKKNLAGEDPLHCAARKNNPLLVTTLLAPPLVETKKEGQLVLEALLSPAPGPANLSKPCSSLAQTRARQVSRPCEMTHSFMAPCGCPDCGIAKQPRSNSLMNQKTSQANGAPGPEA